MRSLLLIIVTTISVFSKAQNSLEHLLGKWEGIWEKEYNVKFEINENPADSDSKYNFSILNFRNDSFLITQSKFVDKCNEIIVVIQKASLSYYPSWTFTYGTLKIKCLEQNKIELSIKSVGPSGWKSYDQQIGMSDMENIIMTRN